MRRVCAGECALGLSPCCLASLVADTLGSCDAPGCSPRTLEAARRLQLPTSPPRSLPLPTEATLHLVLRLRGGVKKRKKKTYTTPKRIPHKHKHVKLAILKYYKVDDNGKVTRLRKECPNEDCGSGVFMANHFDRCVRGRLCVCVCACADDGGGLATLCVARA